MMAPEKQFVDRAKSVTAYLRSIKDLERAHQTPGRGFYRAAQAISASRAASFIMMYNCIEFGVRDATEGLRKKIAVSGTPISALKPHWREEIVGAKFHERLQNGTNHRELIRDFSLFIPGDVNWYNKIDRIPFAGNVDNLRVMDFLRKAGQRWRPPPSSLGGSDLDLIRRVRNDLAHGKEEFEAVGSNYSTDELIQKYDRARKFMVSFIKTMHRYGEGSRFTI